jgi:hypothetical protein
MRGESSSGSSSESASWGRDAFRGGVTREPSGTVSVPKTVRTRKSAREEYSGPRPQRLMKEVPKPITEAGDDPAVESRPPPHGQVEVSNSRGVQIGDGNWQDNFYIWDVKTPPIDLAKCLESTDVRPVVRALAADPTDRAARQNLLRKIAPEPLLGAPTTKLQVSQLGRPGVIPSDSPLIGTLFLRGLQVGDGNIQRNTFTYAVAPTADADGLLRENPKLAKALIDCAFPEEGSSDVATVNAALRDALEHAKVVPNDGIKRSENHQMPAPGEVLRLRNIDGVSVGAGSTVHRIDEIKADQVTVVKRPLASKAPQPPGFARLLGRRVSGREWP